VCTDVTGECIVSIFTDMIDSYETSLSLYEITRYHNPEHHDINVTLYLKIAQEVPGALYFVAQHSKIGTNLVVNSAGLIILLTWLQ
jgi:hypothetical protein